MKLKSTRFFQQVRLWIYLVLMVLAVVRLGGGTADLTDFLMVLPDWRTLLHGDLSRVRSTVLVGSQLSQELADAEHLLDRLGVQGPSCGDGSPFECR